jgi:cytokinin dehydrogenase
MNTQTQADLSELLAAAKLPLDTAESVTVPASSDFGRIASGRAHGVIRIERTEQLPTLIRLARTQGLHLTVRGAGLSQSGQSVPRDGLLVDTSGLRGIQAPDLQALSVVCQPGATWRDVLARVAPLGLTPHVMPLNLDLTLGGTLSAGGLGSSSHRHGLCVSNVGSVDVVLGTGEVVRCSSSVRRDVFDSVLGGLGRVGIMQSVEVRLARTAPTVRISPRLHFGLDSRSSARSNRPSAATTALALLFARFCRSRRK